MAESFRVTVCASGGGGNFEALIHGQKIGGYSINLLIVDRICGAIEKAYRYNVPVTIINKKELGESFYDEMDRAIPADTNLIVLAGFLPIINKRLCDKYQGRIINTHPSLLPKYGGKGMYGVKVQEAVLANRDRKAGCTVHYVNEIIDGGSIIMQKSIPVLPNESAWELGGRVFKEENKLLVQAVIKIMKDQKVKHV